MVEVRDADGMLVGLDGPDFTFVLEVGRGTLEMTTGPHDDLAGLESSFLMGMEHLLHAAGSFGWQVLGYGMQPLSAGTVDFLTAKPRYRTLLDSLGPDWLWFTLTASDQTHVAVGRPELVATTNLASLLTPAVIALCANSPIWAERDQGVCCGRESEMGRIQADHHRHGMPQGPLASVEDLVARTLPQHFLMRKDNGRLVANHTSFEAHLKTLGGAEGDDAWAAYLLHEHYTWNSARPRTAHSTLELRSACQQPPGSHLVATALSLAIVEGAPELAALREARMGAETWPQMRAWHAAVITHGLAAPTPTPGLLTEILEHCEAALGRRGRSEARFLAPLWQRLEAGMSPAQSVRADFAAGGIPALLDGVRWG